MTEYTSLEVSKRLIEAGFDGMGGFDNVGYPFKWLERVPGDADLVEGWHGVESGDGPIAYRSDTLLAWLMEHATAVYTDKKNDVYYVYSFTTGVRMSVESLTAPTLPDALAEVVIKVLEVRK